MTEGAEDLHGPHAAAQLNAFLIHSLGRKPGEVMDDTDVRLYQREFFPLLDAVRTGKLHAAFECARDGVLLPAVECHPAIWELIHFLRGSEFRPTLDAVGRKVRQVLGLPPETVSGGDARARRVISAPPRLPWGQKSADPPLDPDAPWVRRFARELARGDEGFDAALLTVLARLPTDLARERLMTELAVARGARQSAPSSNPTQTRAAEKTALQAALETVAAYRSSNQEKETTAP